MVWRALTLLDGLCLGTSIKDISFLPLLSLCFPSLTCPLSRSLVFLSFFPGLLTLTYSADVTPPSVFLISMPALLLCLGGVGGCTFPSSFLLIFSQPVYFPLLTQVPTCCVSYCVLLISAASVGLLHADASFTLPSLSVSHLGATKVSGLVICTRPLVPCFCLISGHGACHAGGGWWMRLCCGCSSDSRAGCVCKSTPPPPRFVLSFELKNSNTKLGRIVDSAANFHHL